jgi:hypothetical protein
MCLKLLIITRFGFILAVMGVFTIVISYFTQSDYISGIALVMIGIVIFIIGSSIKHSQRH